jgi:2-polyprenyl-3-methyl-5-hydroxy-6-metoxy-1,4-benzoquinol methylase
MNRNIPYHKQTLETPNLIARFAHRKRYEFSLSKVLEYMGNNDKLLDIGCGDGSFLNKLANIKPDAVLYGFDPEVETVLGKFVKVDSLSVLEDQKMNIICCFETLEHLYQNERDNFYLYVKRLLVNDGKVLISIPVIGGPVLLVKEFNRMTLFRRKSEYALKELLLAAFLGKPAMTPENPRITHKGFNFRDIEKQFSWNGFRVFEKTFSPFPLLPWFLNSQVFFGLSLF